MVDPGFPLLWQKLGVMVVVVQVDPVAELVEIGNEVTFLNFDLVWEVFEIN